MGKVLKEDLYAHSPIWFQNVMVNIQGFQFRYRRAKPSILRKRLEFLLQAQYWTEAQFREYQAARLRETLRNAFSNVPYYREMQKRLGCEPEDFRVPEDIRQLPMLDKSLVRQQPQMFLNDKVNLKRCNKGHTSGTTGSPMDLYSSSESFSLCHAFISRLRTWAGLSNPHFPRRAQFTGQNIVPSTQQGDVHVYWRYNVVGRAMLVSTTHLSPDTVCYYANAIRRFSPELMDGYPSALLVLVRLAKRENVELPKPKAIITTAETLLPEERQELEEAFGCKVFNQYAASEPSCLWCDCEYGSMHVSPEYGISEILDEYGQEVQPGGEGEVVVTSFLNPVEVLIRYRIGDLAVRGPDELCLCGRQMPRIERVSGRVEDILFFPGRGYAGGFNNVIKYVNHIVEAQIVQEVLEGITVLVVPDENFSMCDQEKLVSELRKKVGHRVHIDIRLVDRIPRGPNGKFNAVVSKVRHLYPDRM